MMIGFLTFDSSFATLIQSSYRSNQWEFEFITQEFIRSLLAATEERRPRCFDVSFFN